MNEEQKAPTNEPTPPPKPPITPPVQPPVTPPTVPVGQPPAPGQPAARDQTDVMGIVSIILPFVGLSLIGIVIGLIGASKAKKEGRSPLLSRIGWIVSAVITLLSILLITFIVIAAVISAQRAQDTAKQAQENSSLYTDATANTTKVSADGFSLVVPKDFMDLPDEYKNPNASYTQGDDYTSEYALVIKESRADFSDTMDVNGYANLINDSNYTGTEAAVSEATLAPLTGVSNPLSYSTVDYQVTGVSGGVKIVYYIRYAATANYFYQIVTWTLPSQAVTAKPDLVKILESFEEA